MFLTPRKLKRVKNMLLFVLQNCYLLATVHDVAHEIPLLSPANALPLYYVILVPALLAIIAAEQRARQRERRIAACRARRRGYRRRRR